MARLAGTEPPTPIYWKIAADIRRRILAGEWNVGTMLPGRGDLATRYAVAQKTLDRAVADLLSEGTLRTEHRRGTYVASLPEQSDEPTTNVSGVIGVIARYAVGASASGEIDNILKRGIISAIESAAAADHARIILTNIHGATGSPDMRISDVAATLKRQGAQAIICVFPSLTDIEYLQSHCTGRDDMPGVVISSGEHRVTNPHVKHVTYDNHAAAYLAAEHLVQAGWDDVVFYSPVWAPWVDIRRSGAAEGLRAAKPTGMLTSVVQDRPFPDDEWEGKISLLAEEDAPLLMPLIRPKTGIVCVNDAAAIGVRNAFAPEGLVAGRDYGMVGFDDSPASLDAGITTLRPPLERLGRTAYDIASGHNSRQSSGERICHHSLLVRRTSSTPSRTQAIPPESG